jgi:hypothetical protein
VSDHLEKRFHITGHLLPPSLLTNKWPFFFKGANIPEECWKTAQGMGIYIYSITVEDDDDSDDVYVSEG